MVTCRWRRLTLYVTFVISYVILINLVARSVHTVIRQSPWLSGIRPSLQRQQQPPPPTSPTQQQQDEAFLMTRISREHQTRLDVISKFCNPDNSSSNNSSFSPNHTVSPGIRRFLAFSDHHRLVYCGIQKVGTSFWIRVMKILVGRLKEGSLFQGSFEHGRGIRGKYSFLDSSKSRVRLAVTTYRKFLFVRDPYSRLFSAYVDKVFLPNHRAFTVARQLGTVERDTYKGQDDGKARNQTGRTNPQHVSCLFNVSFASFLEVITSRSAPSDEHWAPMHRHCDPCAVGYDYVGKMETFKQDAEFILKEAGVNLSFLSGDWASFHRENDLLRLTDLARKRYNVSRKMLRCRHDSSPSDAFMCLVMWKIWIALQTRGLISTSVLYPLPRTNCLAVDEDRFVQAVIEAFQRSGRREARMRQRQEALMEAYSGLPRWLLERVERYVHDDCVMFGYACDTRVRFAEGGVNNSPSGYSYFGSFT